MSESVETTLEEASRCPKCGEIGELTQKRALRGRGITRGAQLNIYTCRNTRCRWCNEVCRAVQVNPDGTIPPPLMKREKQFPKVPDIGDQVNAALERQLGLELGGGAEVNR